MRIFILLFLTSLWQMNPSAEDYFAATTHLKELFTVEKQMIKALTNYLDLENQRLNRVKQLVKRFKSSAFKGSDQEEESYLNHPINAYLLIKRLTADKEKLDKLMNDSQASESIETMLKNLSLPTREDLSGAAEAIVRLQKTYKLDAKQLADGIILFGDKKVTQKTSRQQKFTADDCFELRKHAYDIDKTDQAIVWLQLALDRLEEANLIADQTKIFEYLALAFYKKGDIRKALEFTRLLIKLVPDHLASENVTRFEKELKETKQTEEDKQVASNSNERSSNESLSKDEEEEKDPEPLCRGEKLLSPKIESKLKCFYLNTSGKPFLRLTRVKVEEAYKKPHIVIFHQILSNAEIDLIKSVAEPKLARSGILKQIHSQNITTELSKKRISKSIYLNDKEHLVLQTISKRIQAITGFAITSIERWLQVANYGIGGHYIPHYDYLGFRNKYESEEIYKENYPHGNRVATWMNYMSDVEAGGATVFPQIGVTVWPQKGSAVFWYNLLRSGVGDKMTIHSACPVLVGSKWVSNKWIHESGQEFLSPCSRNPKQYHTLS